MAGCRKSPSTKRLVAAGLAGGLADAAANFGRAGLPAEGGIQPSQNCKIPAAQPGSDVPLSEGDMIATVGKDQPLPQPGSFICGARNIAAPLVSTAWAFTTDLPAAVWQFLQKDLKSLNLGFG